MSAYHTALAGSGSLIDVRDWLLGAIEFLKLMRYFYIESETFDISTSQNFLLLVPLCDYLECFWYLYGTKSTN